MNMGLTEKIKEINRVRNSDKECAKIFCDAIRTMAKNPDTIDNLESYLENCFSDWMKIYANEPYMLAKEMTAFAEMNLED